MFSPLNRGPRLAMVELTNHCNLRCKMCGIWAEPDKRIMDKQTFSSLLRDKVFKHTREIALTGGEPFLIPDIKDYYLAVRKHCPRSYVNISTNGFLTSKILDFVRKVRAEKLTMAISYDGTHSHDTVRGVKGSKARLMETARRLHDEFPEMPLSLKLTITPHNYDEILDTAKECQEIGIRFRFKTMEKINCHQNRYPSEISEPDYSPEMMARIQEQAREILDMDLETNRQYIRKLLELGTKEQNECTCDAKTVFIGVDGKIFLCRRREDIGNVFERSFSEIWSSGEKRKRVEEMKDCVNTKQSISFIRN